MVGLQDYRPPNGSTPSAGVLQTVSDAALSDEDRLSIVQQLLDDIEATGPTSTLGSADVAPALVTLKTVCRHPSASRIIISENNLRILQKCTDLPSPAGIEALRCIANGLLLHEIGRERWLALNGGQQCIERLENEHSSPEECFVNARVLFLVTLKKSPFIVEAVKGMRLPDVVAAGLKRTQNHVQMQTPYAKEALTDLLKVSFNLMIHYTRATDGDMASGDQGNAHTRVLGELWDGAFQSLVDPLFLLLQTLPVVGPMPLQPPLTYVVNNLINVPVDKSNEMKWVSPAGNANAASCPLHTLWHLLDQVLAHYAPYDPDDPAVLLKCRSEGVVLDELLVPLPVILAHLAKNSAIAREYMHSSLFPRGLDRSKPLEQRSDLLGRCIRLMSSIHNPRLKETVGEMMFMICNENASELAGLIGYGNAAGYLFNKGITAAPTLPSTLDMRDINPITGTSSTPHLSEEMTDEEKEAEAERLFVLFDRLEHAGMGVNPIRQAQKEGRLA